MTPSEHPETRRPGLPSAIAAVVTAASTPNSATASRAGASVNVRPDRGAASEVLRRVSQSLRACGRGASAERSGVGRLGAIAAPALGGYLLARGLAPTHNFLISCLSALIAAVATALLTFRGKRGEFGGVEEITP